MKILDEERVYLLEEALERSVNYERASVEKIRVMGRLINELQIENKRLKETLRKRDLAINLYRNL